MPCDDVTEVMEVVLDAGDHLHDYRLIKRSCGRAVGEERLILEEMQGLHADQLLSMEADEFADRTPGLDEVELFLRLKHLFALQGSLRALMGLEPASATSPVRAARVAYEEEHVLFEAEIVVDIITEKIESCGRCKGCGSIAKKLAAAAAS